MKIGKIFEEEKGSNDGRGQAMFEEPTPEPNRCPEEVFLQITVGKGAATKYVQQSARYILPKNHPRHEKCVFDLEIP